MIEDRVRRVEYKKRGRNDRRITGKEDGGQNRRTKG